MYIWGLYIAYHFIWHCDQFFLLFVMLHPYFLIASNAFPHKLFFFEYVYVSISLLTWLVIFTVLKRISNTLWQKAQFYYHHSPAKGRRIKNQSTQRKKSRLYNITRPTSRLYPWSKLVLWEMVWSQIIMKLMSRTNVHAVVLFRAKVSPNYLEKTTCMERKKRSPEATKKL